MPGVRDLGRPALHESVKERRRLAGDALRERRMRSGLTQLELAQKAGLTVMTVGRIERGESAGEVSCALIAEAMHLPPDWHVRPETIAGELPGSDEAPPERRGLELLFLSGLYGPVTLRAVEALLETSRKDWTNGEWIAGAILSRLESIATPSRNESTEGV